MEPLDKILITKGIYLKFILGFFIWFSSSFGNDNSEIFKGMLPQEISVEKKDFIEKSIKNREYFLASKGIMVMVNNGLFIKGKNEVFSVRVEKFDIASLYENNSQYAAVILNIEDDNKNYYELTTLIFSQEGTKQINSVIIKNYKIKDLIAYDFKKYTPPGCEDKEQPFPGCVGYCYEIPYIKVILYDDKTMLKNTLCFVFRTNNVKETVMERINCKELRLPICDK